MAKKVYDAQEKKFIPSIPKIDVDELEKQIGKIETNILAGRYIQFESDDDDAELKTKIDKAIK